eukprot:CAMPEP_0182425032 /NCGR_PEP_ID=MMETSP1167-20130531/11366_1 /TAXON_ID=2988 /ORGANISM="Mallomonas Sp, Strain CCMP3275" /LENGTH=255 /DNA_ID=CAMNT_0024605343 /DNA_START=244 /DNA_END=1011 /DNA_ORIENTATION=+
MDNIKLPISHRNSISIYATKTEENLSDEEKDFLLIERVEKEVLAESGVSLEDLINPSRVINLSRDVVRLTQQLEDTSSASEKNELSAKIEKKTKDLNIEKRAVFRGWLKNLFIGQSVLAGAASILMVYDAVPNTSLPLAVRVLGFWMWWLFIIPSLRARKPSAQEKEALNWAFLASPLVSVSLPSVTRDTVIIWWANAAVVLACYVWAFNRPTVPDSGEGRPAEEEKEGGGVPKVLRQAWKALDYGSGQERGLRK